MQTTSELTFSFIVPVYNRPDEMAELLESLAGQQDPNFEVVIVEDGSEIPAQSVYKQYKDKLNIAYFAIPNSGPGLARNFGMKQAKGNYFIILDSDVIVPPHYLKFVRHTLRREYTDAYGGPDAAHPAFSPIQKAISFAMTSILTTGGIRGASEKAGKFYPRSFNMGLSKEVFKKTGGFSAMRFGEDIDLSIRIMQNGFNTRLFSEAFVYHKRRNNLVSFFKQVFNSGIARINLYVLHKKSLKPAHFFPAIFTLGLLLGIILLILGYVYIFILYVLYALVVFLEAFRKEKNVKLAAFSVFSSFVMLIGYGLGFMFSIWKRLIMQRPVFEAFSQNFYD